MPEQPNFRRGFLPDDPQLFSEAACASLRVAAGDLSYLLARGYSMVASLKLVGDHHQLVERQRMALRRNTCSAAAAAARKAARRPVAGQDIVIDGFNILVTLEVALCGGPLFRGNDGLLRDLAAVHGGYRLLSETEKAIECVMQVLQPAQSVLWLLDQPVARSGELASVLRRFGASVSLVQSPDTLLRQVPVAATADGPILDAAGASVDLVGAVVADWDLWIIDLSP